MPTNDSVPAMTSKKTKKKCVAIFLALMFISNIVLAATLSTPTPMEKDFWTNLFKASKNAVVTKELSTIQLTVKTRTGIILKYSIPAIKIGVNGKYVYLLSKELFKSQELIPTPR